MTTDRTRWYALYVLCLATLMIVLDTTIVNVALRRSARTWASPRLACLGRQRLPAHVRRLPAAGRPARRLFRPAAAFSRRDRSFTLASLACGLAESQGCWCRTRRAGSRRRVRLRRLAVLTMTLFTYAGRSGEGDGPLRLRRGGRRQRRRPARRRPDRPLSWHWIFLVNVPIGVAVCLLALPYCLPTTCRGARHASTWPVRSPSPSALMLAVYAIVNGNERGLDLGADARPARRRGRSARRLPADRVAGRVAAGAAPALPAAQPLGRERRRSAVGCGDVRLVLPLRALPAARARLQPAPRSGSRSSPRT